MQMKGDPRWITSNKTIVCAGCAGTIRKGSKAFFYPNTQTGYCTETDCGIKHAADFEAHRQDQDGY